MSLSNSTKSGQDYSFHFSSRFHSVCCDSHKPVSPRLVGSIHSRYGTNPRTKDEETVADRMGVPGFLPRKKMFKWLYADDLIHFCQFLLTIHWIQCNRIICIAHSSQLLHDSNLTREKLITFSKWYFMHFIMQPMAGSGPRCNGPS